MSCRCEVRLGPRRNGDVDTQEAHRIADAIVAEAIRRKTKEPFMHYRNGRKAENGDKVVMLSGYGSGATVNAVGVLYDAKPGNSHCNGNLAPIQNPISSACLCDCIHVDDLAEILKEHGLDKRPEGM